MSTTHSSYLMKSVLLLALVFLMTGASMYFGKTLGRNIMALTRSNIEERFEGQDPIASEGDGDFMLDVVSGRTSLGYDESEFGSNPFPREWADPPEEELEGESEEPVVEINILDEPVDGAAEEGEGDEDEGEGGTAVETEEDTGSRRNLFDLGSAQVFRIQVGTFSERDNAENVWNRLTQAGYDASISTYEDDDTVRYRVQVGNFGGREAADEVAEELRSMNFDAWVFQIQ